MQLVNEYTTSKKYVPNDPILAVFKTSLCLSVKLLTGCGSSMPSCTEDARSIENDERRLKRLTG